MRIKTFLEDLVWKEETDLLGGQLWFNCPVCFNSEKAHAIYVPFLKVMGSGFINKTFWSMSGKSIADISIRPSIKILKGCGFHGFITNGIVEYWVD